MTMRAMHPWATSSPSTSSTSALTQEHAPASSLRSKAPKNSALRSTERSALPSSRRRKCGEGAHPVSFAQLDRKDGRAAGIAKFDLRARSGQLRVYVKEGLGSPPNVFPTTAPGHLLQCRHPSVQPYGAKGGAGAVAQFARASAHFDRIDALGDVRASRRSEDRVPHSPWNLALRTPSDGVASTHVHWTCYGDVPAMEFTVYGRP